MGRIPYLQAHPYFLPCAVAGLLAFVTFAISFFGLKEVSCSSCSRTPSDELDGPQITKESQLLRPPRYGIDHTSESPTSTGNGSSNSGYRAILTRPLLMTLTNHIFLTFLDMCHFVLLTIHRETDPPSPPSSSLCLTLLTLSLALMQRRLSCPRCSTSTPSLSKTDNLELILTNAFESEFQTAAGYEVSDLFRITAHLLTTPPPF